MVGTTAAIRVVKVLEGEGWAQWVFGHRIEPLGPNAKISVARGGEINGIAIGRELRLIVFVRTVGYGDQIRLAGGSTPHHLCDQYLSGRSRPSRQQSFKHHPAVIPGEESMVKRLIPLTQEIVLGSC